MENRRSHLGGPIPPNMPQRPALRHCTNMIAVPAGIGDVAILKARRWCADAVIIGAGLCVSCLAVDAAPGVVAGSAIDRPPGAPGMLQDLAIRDSMHKFAQCTGPGDETFPGAGGRRFDLCIKHTGFFLCRSAIHATAAVKTGGTGGRCPGSPGMRQLFAIHFNAGMPAGCAGVCDEPRLGACGRRCHAITINAGRILNLITASAAALVDAGIGFQWMPGAPKMWQLVGFFDDQGVCAGLTGKACVTRLCAGRPNDLFVAKQADFLRDIPASGANADMAGGGRV